jgi:hypothetical protein
LLGLEKLTGTRSNEGEPRVEEMGVIFKEHKITKSQELEVIISFWRGVDNFIVLQGGH